MEETMKNNRHKLDFSYVNLGGNLENARFLDRENKNLVAYLKEVRRYKPLTDKEEIEHISNYQKRVPGYERDLELVMGYNLRFVIMIAKRYCPTDIDICDLIGEGNYGMMVAINNFDVTLGTKFITYAGRCVIKYIFEYLENNGFIKQPNRSKIHGVIDRITEEFFAKNGYDPTIDDIEQAFAERGVNVKDKSDFVQITIESMDAPIVDDGDETPREFGEDDNIEERANDELVKDNLHKAIDSLPEVEKSIIIKTFGFNGPEESTATIAFELGISEYKVKTHLASAITKLQKFKAMFA